MMVHRVAEVVEEAVVEWAVPHSSVVDKNQEVEG